MKRLLAPALAVLPVAGLVALAFVACGPRPSDAPPTGGDGVVTLDGVATAYRIVPDESRLLLLVRATDEPGCGAFHSHVVEATSMNVSFELDDASPADSFFEAVVAAAGLDPDSEENSARYPETETNSFNQGQRDQVFNSIWAQVKGDDFEEMSFRGTGLSTIIGADATAEIEVDLAGEQSTVSMAFASVAEGEKLRVSATGVLDGTPHDIPNGFGASCISAEMPMDLVLVLEPVPAQE